MDSLPHQSRHSIKKNAIKFKCLSFLAQITQLRQDSKQMQSTSNFRQRLGQLTLKINQDSPISPIQRQDSQEDQFEANFVLGDKLGEGAHCAVFKAYSKQDSKEYAVKIFRTFDEEMIEIIKRTFLIQQMTNNNQQFLMTYDLFLNPQKGIHYMVTEYCAYPTLESLIHIQIKLHIQRLIIRNLAQAILYIHSKRICHRDIKPDNILVDIESGNIKLIDFGVAQIFGGSRDIMMTPTGDPKYRAPEVTSTYGYDEAIDIWSLGIVAYQMFTANMDLSDISLEKYRKQNPSHMELISGMLEENHLMRRTAHEILHQIQQPSLSINQTNLRSKSVEQQQSQTPIKKETKSAVTYSRKDVLKYHNGLLGSPKFLYDPNQINKTLLSKVMSVTESTGSCKIELSGVIKSHNQSNNSSVSLDSTEDYDSWLQK